MAHIDDLVKKVSDPQLRAALADQVRTLTDRTEFGLTFQRHLPESVRLPEQRIRRGDLVELRDEAKGGPRYRVVSAKAADDAVAVVELDDAGEPVGETVGKLKTDLVVVTLFGDPIYPGLRQVDEAGTAAAGQPTHVVINGENFHTLQALEYTHEGRVDLIYIDPPYNTGAADWKYNDRYVDGADSYRHSKWLSFMERRLKIAKRLLAKSGVVIVAIGDDEHHRLRMLMDQTFGESNFIANITWQGIGSYLARHTAGGVDYMLVYGKDASTVGQFLDVKSGVDGMKLVVAEALEAGTTADAEIALRAFIKANKKSLDGGLENFSRVDERGRIYDSAPLTNSQYRPNLKYPVVDPETGTEYLPPDNGWKISSDKMAELIEDGLVIFGGKYPRKKKVLDEYTTFMPIPTFTQMRTRGSQHLERILGDKRFPFPKDHEVLMRWIRMAAPKNAVVLDFFAGSGSTAEAVIRLNQLDGGTRQCILVTNNELSKKEDAALRAEGYRPGDEEYEAFGVFHHVTKPRVSTVLTGLREDGSKFSDGIEGQAAAFFDLTYEDENLIALGHRFEAVAPLLWLTAGATGRMIDKIDGSGFSVPEDANYAVIFDTDTAAQAVEALHDGIKLVYVVTDSDADFRSTIAALPRRLQPTTQRLYSTYLRSFEINRG